MHKNEMQTMRLFLHIFEHLYSKNFTAIFINYRPWLPLKIHVLLPS